MTKSLTRTESPGVIVLWQALSVTLLSLPLGLLHWSNPAPWHWLGFAIAGVLGALVILASTVWIARREQRRAASRA
jgi:drug/metabolite transporter (DMT)-like permease